VWRPRKILLVRNEDTNARGDREGLPKFGTGVPKMSAKGVSHFVGLPVRCWVLKGSALPAAEQ